MADKYLWWKDGIIYQIYPRSFSDSDNDGIGDLPGIMTRLDYLQYLGVDAIWLSPVYPSSQIDFGYDVSNYTDIDPLFGSLKDFDNLVKEAHNRNIRVIMDLVLNHTSDDHPWFIQSRKSRDNPYRDWYIWRDPKSNGAPPNNWFSIFGGKAWEYEQTTEQYYLHSFHTKQPDLNWRNPLVQKAILSVLKFWLERGTDGFRLDVFNTYFKHAQLPNNPCQPGIRGFERQRHFYDMDQPEMIPLLQEFRKLLDRYPERYMVGETQLATPAKAAFYSGPDRLHTAFNFKLMECGWNPVRFLDAIKQLELATSDPIWPSNVLNNHDNPRSVTRWHDNLQDARAKVGATLLLTLRGTPFIYNGEEIGMRNIKLKRNEIKDPPGKRYWPLYKGRDGCRSPMQWDASDYSGFSKSKPWLPLNLDYHVRNVYNQQNDQNSLLNCYRHLIGLRRKNAALRRGDFSIVKSRNHRCIIYLRSYRKNKLLVALNFSKKTQKLNLEHTDNNWWREVFSTHPSRLKSVSLKSIKLESYQATIFELIEGV